MDFVAENERRCKGPCGDVLPLEAFEPDRAGRAGRKSTCRECRKTERRGAGRPPGTRVPGLRATREALGLSQRDLACLLGVDRTTISNIERGRSKASGGLASEILATVVNMRRQREGRHEFQRSSEYEETLA